MDRPPLPTRVRTLDDVVELLRAATNYEERLPPSGSERVPFKLETTRRLLAALGDPQRGLRTVHVAGSKGKGSVSRMVESGLRAAGRGPVGLYTSPHLIVLNERVAIDGVPVADDELAAAAERLRPYVSEAAGTAHAPSFFELMTALAWCVFAMRGCRHVVLETGMGGRLDATNVCEPAVTLLTTVEREHVAYLGDTMEAIAAEKAGILKPGVPAFSGVRGPGATVIAETAARVGSPLRTVDEAFREIHAETQPGPSCAARLVPVRGDAVEIRLPVAGAHQARNAALALLGLEALGVEVPAAVAGLEGVHLPGILESLGGHPEMVIDGAHTPESMARTVEAFRLAWPGAAPVVLFALLEGKPPADVAGPLRDLARGIVVTQLDTPRAVPASDILTALGAGPPVAEAIADPAAALARARTWAGRDGVVLVVGSVRLAGWARSLGPGR